MPNLPHSAVQTLFERFLDRLLSIPGLTVDKHSSPMVREGIFLLWYASPMVEDYMEDYYPTILKTDGPVLGNSGE